MDNIVLVLEYSDNIFIRNVFSILVWVLINMKCRVWGDIGKWTWVSISLHNF